jgi:hypothetical protein
MAKTVTQIQFPGSNSPTFIIKDGESYYVTQSVAKYDRSLSKTEAQVQGYDGVRQLFNQLATTGHPLAGHRRDAVAVPAQNNISMFQHVSDDFQ